MEKIKNRIIELYDLLMYYRENRDTALKDPNINANIQVFINDTLESMDDSYANDDFACMAFIYFYDYLKKYSEEHLVTDPDIIDLCKKRGADPKNCVMTFACGDLITYFMHREIDEKNFFVSELILIDALNSDEPTISKKINQFFRICEFKGAMPGMLLEFFVRIFKGNYTNECIENIIEDYTIN